MRRVAALAAGLFLLLPMPAVQAKEDPAVPEPGFLEPVPASGTCVPDRDLSTDPSVVNPYEQQQYIDEGWSGPDYERYPGACRRLRFVFGPIHTKPGQNDVLLEPVTIAKPAFDGYVVRFEPNLIEADGTVPGVHEIHLHHAVWLALGRNYGEGYNPFFATGEEKTIMTLPEGYGMPVRATDTWQILYMIHNQFPQPRELFLTYELDVIPASSPAAAGIKPVYPVWLDVNPGFYPVFNTQRGFGTGGVCTWPTENCADFDPWGDQTWHQGCSDPQECPPPDNVVGLPPPGGSYGRISNFRGGTLVHIAGHLHPGGLTVQVEQLRAGQTPRRIFTSEGHYWSGQPTSWDMSMTAAYLPNWGVRVAPGDGLRITASYDTAIQSTYENMGIVVAWIAPHTATGAPTAPGLDPFVDGLPAGYDEGVVTHGHLAENNVTGGPAPVPSPPAPIGSQPGVISIAGFQYLPGGPGTNGVTGIPSVAIGQSLRFVNVDAAANIWHSITSCAYPCEGSAGIAFPLSDGASSEGASVDFDSGQLGFWIPTLGPAKNRADWQLQVTDAQFDPGVYTFFCRVHPFMRGAFAAVEGEPQP